MGRTQVRQTRATKVEQLVTLLGAVWLTLGAFLDGYAHQNIIDTATEDFFTPWHALFYSGFLATSAWLLAMALRRPATGRLIDRFPVGYQLGAVGLVIFAVGGIADGVWHTRYGVETSVDALLSPSHLLLFTGLILIGSSPLRAAWASEEEARGWGDLAIPIVSAALVTAGVAFFFTYVWGLSDNGWLAVRYIPETQEGFGAVAFGVTATLLSTVVLVAPVVLLLRRWVLPFGAVALTWTLVAILERVSFDGDGLAVPAALVGGLAFDLALLWRTPHTNWKVRAASLVGPVVMWSFWMWLSRRSPGIAMPVEIWTGLIVFSGLAGLGLALVGFPPPMPSGRAVPRAKTDLGA